MKTLKQLHAIEYTKILEDMENNLWEADIVDADTPYKFPPQALRASSKILASVLWDIMYTQAEFTNSTKEERIKKVTNAGRSLRNLIKKYTNLDPHNFYK